MTDTYGVRCVAAATRAVCGWAGHLALMLE